MNSDKYITQLYESVNSQYTIGTDEYYDSRNDMAGKSMLIALGMEFYNQEIQNNNFKQQLFRPANLIAPNTGLTKNTASPSKGFISFQGTPGASMLAGTQIKSPAGLLYTTLSIANMNAVAIQISSITSNGSGLITVTTVINHNFASNLIFDIVGVLNPAYNTTGAVITVTGVNTFTFEKTVPLGTSSGGTVNGNLLSVEVQSQSLGSTVNVDRGVKMSLLSTISGINNDGYVQYTKILGGNDEELESDFDIRTLESVKSPQSLFNDRIISIFLKKINGITRVFTRRIGTSSQPYCIVRFMRDNDINPFPDTQAVAQARDAILNGFGTEQPIWPLPIDDSYLNVGAPIPNPCNIAFTYVLAGGYSTSLRDKISFRFKNLFTDPNIAKYETPIQNYYIQVALIQALNDDNTLGEDIRQAILDGMVITYTNPSFVDSLATLGIITYV